MATSPVILLASANSATEYLRELEVERGAIDLALRGFSDNRFIQVVQVGHTSLGQLFDECNRYAPRLAIFHYSGHASGTQLLLEGSGGSQAANATGLAQLFGQMKSLQLVFLNGCATRDQVKTLFGQGVKAVIATSAPIQDGAARDFAKQFYSALATTHRPTIHEAFLRAQALMQANAQAGHEVHEFRGMGDDDEPAGTATEMLWGLYVRPGGDEVLRWRLPEAAEHQVTFVTSAPQPPRPQAEPAAAAGAQPVAKPNALAATPLVQALLSAVLDQRDDMREKWERRQRRGADPRLIAPMILDCFPTPVAEQLRKLFADIQPSAARLRQFVITYETLIQLLCFAALAELWDRTHEDATLIPTPEQIAAVEGFVSIGKDSQPTFDYLTLTGVITDVFRAYQLRPFVQELEGVTDLLNQPDFYAAFHFMERLRRTSAAGAVNPGAIAASCQEAEAHLATILTRLAFIVRYQLAVTKSINVSKSRHREPEYIHLRVLLDNMESEQTADIEMAMTHVTDTAAVILSRIDNDDAPVAPAQRDRYLSLTPFVVDANALTGHPNSKLFFYSHCVGGEYHYRFIGDADDELVVDDTTYGVFKKQFETFVDEVRP
jgi:hypothetical protein